MGQASVLTDTEIRRVLRIIETTRHTERNRLCFRVVDLQWSSRWGNRRTDGWRRCDREW